MKIITRDTDYAIRALVSVAAVPGTLVTVKELSGQFDIPGPFLRKIFQILNKEGILKSFKGKSGGFSLEEDPENISIFRLIEIFQGPFRLSEHLFKGEPCTLIKTCLLKNKLDEIEKDVVRKLKEITIEELVQKGKSNGKTGDNNNRRK